jgi:hypothetical protein
MAALNPTHAIKQQLNQPLLNHQNNITDNDDNSFSINSFYPDDYGVRSRSQSHLQNGDSHSLNPSNDSHNYLSRLESIQTPFVQKFLRHIPIATHAMQANEALTTGQAIWQSIPHTHFATHKQHQLTMLEAFFYFYRASSYSIQANVLCGTILDRWSDQDAPACQLLYDHLSAVNDKNKKMEEQLSAVNDKSKQIERNLSTLQTDITAFQKFMQERTNATSTQEGDS